MHHGFLVGCGVGHGIGQVAGTSLLARQLEATEHRVNVRCKGSHVGHHDHDVLGLQSRVLVQPSQDAVVQHFDFALCRMGLHQLKAGVGLAQQHRLHWRGFQVQDVRLQLVQRRGCHTRVKCLLSRIDVHIDPLERRCAHLSRFKFVNRVQVVAAMLAPSGQQRVAFGDDAFGQVPPVRLAGVVHKHQHRNEAPQRHQSFQGLQGQGGDAKHQQTWWQASGQALWRHGLQGFHEGFVHIRAGLEPSLCCRQLGLHIGQQIAPHGGLPKLLWRQGLAVVEQVLSLGPAFQPIGAVVLIAVQHVSQLLCQTKGAAALGVVAQVMRQGRKALVFQPFGQAAQDAPNQRRFVQGHVGREFVRAQHAAVNLPQLAGRQLEAGGRANAQRLVRRQGQGQPMLHAIALHQDGFGGQGRQGVGLHMLHQQVAQTFHAVAVQHHETRRAGSRHSVRRLKRGVSLKQTRAQNLTLYRQTLFRKLSRNPRSHAADPPHQVRPIFERLLTAGCQHPAREGGPQTTQAVQLRFGGLVDLEGP